MIHNMRLYEKPMKSIKRGRKIVEVRLNDEKRRKISIDDLIEFIKIPEKEESLHAKVVDLKAYCSFKEMYEDIPRQDFDCEGMSIDEMLENTYKIYSPEQEKQWGTLAITIKVINGCP